ncbi:SDR family NAD(P)-dependent oxidoreductase [Actinokineospora globicatena]|uniref:SDR family NAD(P)-dependent oxidoreductase n=1 Tax=Actinokineospora globicatena TaxID=103729 RepID=UPI003D7FC6B5
MLNLFKALGETALRVPLWVITQGAVKAERADRVPRPAQAQAWGLGRVAALEAPGRWGGLVDLPEAVDADTAARLGAVLRGGGEDQVAIRRSGVLARRLVPAHAGPPRRAWRPRGSVLVTGGLGALGARVARWLAERGAERIVLTGRRGPATPGAADLRAELQSLGARVVIAARDVTDSAAMAGLLAEHPVNAVFHVAGADGATPLDQTDPDEFAAICATKVRGARVLDELCGDLDAFVLFSSGAGVWGGAGQGAYAAANAFLDAFAEHRRARGATATAISWGSWAGGGMADGTAGELLRRRGVRAMAPEAAIRALRDVLDRDETCVSIADVDWSRFAPAFGSARATRLLDGVPAARAAVAVDGAAFTLGIAALSPAKRRRELLDLVLAHAGAALGRDNRQPDDLRPDRAFRALGFDSVTAVDLRNRLNTATGLALPVTAVFDHPNPAALAAHLDERLHGSTASPTRTTDRVVAGDEPIAIVAMSCRLPGGAHSPEDLWRLVESGAEAISGFPADRGWDTADLYDPEGSRPGTTSTRMAGFLRDAGEFDAGLFDISPREALAMDPQQRLLLEIAWEALERAGIDPTSLKGAGVGTYIGAGDRGYATGGGRLPAAAEGHLLTGTAASVASGRIAYSFGFEGPAVTVDTACSSSLVALHLACQSLRAGECDLAFAGGVTVMSTPTMFVEFSRQRGLAPDGRCKSFEESADGTGWGEGAGLLLLERLSDARRNGREVLAVVRGSAVNSDGASNGLAAPNGPAQERVIRAALANARLAPSDVDAVEGHGTGTVLGDPIEVQALIATYGQGRDRPLWLGSVKPTTGHTQSAAGVTGVIKMVAAMRHGLLPAAPRASTPTSKVDWSAGAVRLLTEHTPWPDTGRPRRAGVSSFGISGTNAHVVLERSPVVEPLGEKTTGAAPVTAWPLSAKTPAALRAQAGRLLAHVCDRPDLSPADVGLALGVSRAALDERAVVLGTDRADLLSGLAALAAGDAAPGVVTGSRATAPVGFVFSGQGGQWPGMGRGLHKAFPAFARAFDEACDAVDVHLGQDRDVRDVVFGPDGALLDHTLWAQPAIFALQVALLRLFESWGLLPDAVLGHSVGEVAAAHAAGVLSLPEAARLVAWRARLMEALPPGGAMVAVAAGEDVVRPLLTDRIGVAAFNAVGSLVVSGDRDALAGMVEGLDALGVRTTWLRVAHAFHSHRMDPVTAEFAEVAGSTRFGATAVPLVSAVTGDLDTTGEVGTPGYWARQVREPVRFADGVDALVREGVGTIVELGPDQALSALVLDGLAVPALRRRWDEAEAVVTALARVYSRGGEVDWRAFYADTGARRVDLPTYAFQREHYWIGSGATPERSPGDPGRYRVTWHPTRGEPNPKIAGTWLVVSAHVDDHTTAAITGALGDRGARVLRITVPGEARDLASVVADVGDLAGVVSLLALDDSPVPGTPWLPGGFVTTASLLRAMRDAGVRAPLWTVTRGGVAVGGAPVSPGQALAWGALRSAGLEHPESWGGLIDLPETWDEHSAARLVGVLAEGREDQVALRVGGVFARRLERAVPPVPGPAWRARGTVLVTGGTGALGAHVARWLVAAGAEHLLLVSRRGVDAPGAGDLRAELVARGARVSIVSCDVADRDALAAVLGDVPEHCPLTAVVHAAGVTGGDDLASLDAACLAEVLSAKVGGAANLDALLDGVELDAFVLFSSVSGVWGAAGQSGYAAGNAYLDALAEHRRSRGSTATAVAWGPWAGDGMASGARSCRSGLPPMTPERALAALRGALVDDETSLVVSDVDWARFAPAFAVARPRPLLDTVDEARNAVRADGDPTASRAGHLTALPPGERAGAVLDLVRSEAAAVLGQDGARPVAPARSFRDLGFDSLMAVELRDRLALATGVRLPAGVVFDHPNTESLAERLHAELFPAADDVDGVLAELDGIERRLAALRGQPRAEARVAARVRALHGRWTGASEEAEVAGVLGAATPDEVFDFIDNQLDLP